MTYQRILYFLQTIKSGSISKAADQLYISAPALSKQLNKLEDEMGGKLFERTSKGIRLTELGEYAADKLSELDQSYRNTIKAIREHAMGERPRIRIGFFIGLPTDTLITPIISFLIVNYPSYRIDFELFESADNSEHFFSGELDLLFTDIIEGQNTNNSHIYEFERSTPAIVVSRKHPWAEKSAVTKDEMSEMTLLKLRNDSSAAIYSKAQAFFNSIPCSSETLVPNYLTLIELLKQGNAFAVLPMRLVDQTHFTTIPYPENDVCFCTVLIHKQDSKLPGLADIVRSIAEKFGLKDLGVL